MAKKRKKRVLAKPPKLTRKRMRELLAEGAELGRQIKKEMAPMFQISAKVWNTRFKAV